MSGETKPNESRVCVMNPIAFAAFCAEEVGLFHEKLLCEGNFIFRAGAHGLSYVPKRTPRYLNTWKVYRSCEPGGLAFHYLVTRLRSDLRSDVIEQLERARPGALEELKAYKAKYLGGVRVYPSISVSLTFELSLVIPFWSE